jgi:glycosyltransferase involved in cell wall biosynthesis
MALKMLKKRLPSLKYLIAGKYDAAEKTRIDQLLRQHGLENEVIFTGFVPDEEIPDHFNLADVYIMPSRGEGFGIVFIEALFYGLPVIAGNLDGSVDALANGRFGLLVNPLNPKELIQSINLAVNDSSRLKPVYKEVIQRFGFSIYKNELKNIIQSYLTKNVRINGLSKSA